MPSGEVMTRFVPVYATAINKFRDAAQQTEIQLLASDAVRLVHVMPSGEVIT